MIRKVVLRLTTVGGLYDATAAERQALERRSVIAVCESSRTEIQKSVTGFIDDRYFRSVSQIFVIIVVHRCFRLPESVARNDGSGNFTWQVNEIKRNMQAKSTPLRILVRAG